ADRLPFANRLGHWAIFMGKWLAGGGVELPGHAPSILPKHRLAAGKFDARLVPIGDAALGVGRVDRGGELIEERGARRTGSQSVDSSVEDLVGMMSGQHGIPGCNLGWCDNGLRLALFPLPDRKLRSCVGQGTVGDSLRMRNICGSTIHSGHSAKPLD